MILGKIQQLIENWAPLEVAWEKDNTGLQIGSPDRSVRKILIALEITPEVVREGVRKKADLIITHHPFFYHPLKSINPDKGRGSIVAELLKAGIAVYSAHTNLDFSRNGVSFALAEAIGLSKTDFLLKNQLTDKKIVVFAPEGHARRVMTAMAEAGAGIIGEYSNCSFSVEGHGTFLPSGRAKPFTGRAGKLENVEETRIEMKLPEWRADKVIAAMKKAHPYEEVAYDIYPLASPSTEHGAGVIGEFDSPMTKERFLGHLGKRLGTKSLRHNNFKGEIRRVALCGGAGSDLIEAASRSGAQAFVTADLTYHRFSDAPEGMLLVDAGHFETEQFAVRALKNYLKKELKERNSDISIFESLKCINPIHYYIS